MAGSVNKVELIGRVGKDPKISTLNSGDKVANFSIATSETWKDKNTGDRRERTEWHNIVVYNDGLIKIIEPYVRKGSLIRLEGSIQSRKYTDQSGAERVAYEIVLQKFRGELTLLGGKDDGAERGGSGDGEGGGSGGGVPRGARTRPGPDFDEDIPFILPWA